MLASLINASLHLEMKEVGISRGRVQANADPIDAHGDVQTLSNTLLLI